MDQTRKILIIDKSPERKKRIQALKDRGFRVYPALKIAEARNRCKPGSYDLIVVNSNGEQDAALELCDEILQRAPKQQLLLIVTSENQLPERGYAVSGSVEELVTRVETLLGRRSTTGEIQAAA